MIDVLPLLLGPEGYQISRSIRLRSSANATFTRTPSVDGNRKKWTWSAWVKRGSLGSSGYLMSCTSQSGNDGIAALYFSGDQLQTYYDTNTTNPSGAVGPAVYRDPSAWYHIVWAVDAANSIHYVYVNNVLVSTDTSKYPVNYDYAMNRSGYVQNMGTQAWGAANYFDGYLTEVNFIDGQALTPSSFGETDAVTGVWKPKKYAGTYGTNGFYLNFSDNSAATAAAIGKDYSGNGNNWTPNNISVTAGATYDSMLDVPTQWADGGNGRGNYCVMSPLDGVLPTTTNGNLQMSIGAGTSSIGCSTFAVTSGKWYWEVSPSTISNNAMRIGVSDFSLPPSGRLSSAAGGWIYASSGNKVNNGTSVSYGSSYTTSNIIGVALDMDTGTLEFFEDGVSQGVAYSTGLAGKLIGASLGSGTGTGPQAAAFNFGQRPFSYTPPTGFKALNTLNLPTPTILKGNQYFDATLWSGNSTDARVITTNVGTVDLAWVKRRNGVDDHRLANSVLGGNKHLKSNTTDAESTGTTVIQAFSGSTFTLGTDGSVNATGGTYVGWTWQEGPTQGFDIVTYTGTGANRTIAHNLGVEPRMIIVKGRSPVSNWNVFHKSVFDINVAYTLQLNSTTYPSGGGSPTIFNSTAPDGSVFSLGSSSDVNGSGSTYVAYLFSEVAGFYKFGSYTGNGSADGPFVFCGFRPRFVLLKIASSTTGSWLLVDSVRQTYNVLGPYLLPDSNGAEGTTNILDFTSNGFKIRGNGGSYNTSSATHIFAAFAENPFKNALAR